MYNFTREDIDLEAIRARIARMSDTELSQAASYRFAGIFVRNTLQYLWDERHKHTRRSEA